MINLTVPHPGDPSLKPCITVIGVGGAGGNAVGNMITDGLQGVEFLVANTDAQALSLARTDRRIQLGANTTQGLGAGAKPEIGMAAAEESIDRIAAELEGSNMVFITAGMGGGTGTGAAPVIARVARELGILTVGVVTKPFQFEGQQRMRLAEHGIEQLSQFVDTLIIIPNQNLFRVANERTTFADAFKMADDVLNAGVRSITDLMIMPGLINLDFADVRTVMSDMGRAMMGTGEAAGERRALEAAEAAISNPLLEDTCMKGARGVLINITGGPDITLFEVDEAANRIRDEVESEAHIIFGSCFDPNMEGRMRVSVVATGISGVAAQTVPRPQNTQGSGRPAMQVPQGSGGGVRAEAAAAPMAEAAPAPAPAHAHGPLLGRAPVAHAPAQAPAQAPAPAAGFRRAPVNAAPAAPAVSARPAVSGPAPRPAPMPSYAQAPAPIPAYAPPPVMAPAPAPVAAPAPAPMAVAAEEAMDETGDYLPQPVAAPRPQPLSMEPPAAPMQPRRPAETPLPPSLASQMVAPQAPQPAPVMAAPRPAAQPAPFQAQPQQRPAFAAERAPMAAAPARPAPRPEPKPSFFNRLTARLTARDDDHAQTAQDEEAARRGEYLAAPEPAAALAISAEDRPVPVRPSEEDELEIPAFLRRQAN